jgi:hypothetical protein
MQTALAAYRIGPTALARAPSEPEVVLEYRRRINEQLDILRPATSIYPGSGAAITAPVAPAQPASEKAPSLESVAAATQAFADSTAPEVAITQAKTAESVIRPAPKKPPPPRCDLRELQLQSLSTHHPGKREQRFFEWLSANGGVCSEAGLIKVKNQMAVWLGTAAGSKRINTTLNELLSPL